MLKKDYYTFLAHSFLNRQQRSAPEFERTPAKCGPKPELKKQAIELRLKGYSYNEILKIIPVAKSTLSVWLRSAKLAKRQVHALTEKKKAGQRKAAARRREQGAETRSGIYEIAKPQVGELSDREIWLICVACYWAEGSKEKSHNVGGAAFDFANMDPRMARIMLYGLRHALKIPDKDIKFEIYIHENAANRTFEVRKYWAKELGLPLPRLAIVRYKKHKPKTNRKNTGALYYGLVRVKVVSSSSLVRYMEGWVKGVDASIEKRLQLYP